MRHSLTIIAEPVAKERPRLGANNNWYTPKATKDFETIVAWSAKKLPRYEGEVCLNITFFCTPRPAAQMPDLDNLIKSVMDGLQKGGALVDDVQVTQINAYRMLERRRPRVELSIVALNPVRELQP